MRLASLLKFICNSPNNGLKGGIYKTIGKCYAKYGIHSSDISVRILPYTSSDNIVSSYDQDTPLPWNEASMSAFLILLSMHYVCNLVGVIC